MMQPTYCIKLSGATQWLKLIYKKFVDLKKFID